MPLAKQQTRRLRGNLLALYAAVMIVFSMSFGLALRQSWVKTRALCLLDLMHDAGAASTLIRVSLIDAGKLLSVTKTRLERALQAKDLTRHRAYDILRSSVEEFGFYTAPESFGLLLFVDDEGYLFARSGEYPAQRIQFSDRFYFSDLRENPGKAFTVGNLVISRTTAKLLFHLSMPVHDAEGKFAGVVAQQLHNDDLSAALVKILGGVEHRIMIQSSNGEVAFLFPPPKNLLQMDTPLNRQILREIRNQKTMAGCFLMRIEPRVTQVGPAGDSSGPYYVGYEYDPVFHLYTSARISMADIRSLFLKQAQSVLGVGILPLLLINGLFLGLFLLSRSLGQALVLSNIDHITSIANRRYFEKELKMLWRDAARRHKRISVLFMDIDHFKAFHDNYGHDTGDEVLREVARCIREILQRPLDLCCRWGGEEFLAVLHDTDTGESVVLAEKIMNCIRGIELFRHGKALPSITISIGVASELITTSNAPENLIDRADRAMRQAKHDGRNMVVVEDQSW